jgi:hypothetical protein
MIYSPRDQEKGLKKGGKEKKKIRKDKKEKRNINKKYKDRSSKVKTKVLAKFSKKKAKF